MTNPADFNRHAIDTGLLTADHIAELVCEFQRAHNLFVDGKAGTRTRAALDVAMAGSEWRVVGDWLHGPDVKHLCAEPSWFGGRMAFGPLAIVAHYTATDPGTALAMARKRLRVRTEDDRLTSWHLTIAADGRVYQMVPLTSRAWHVASHAKLSTSPRMRANECAIGIELEGHGEVFPPAQVEAATHVWRSLVSHYAIKREVAMVEHSSLQDNRSDPGPVWMHEHAPGILDAAYSD